MFEGVVKQALRCHSCGHISTKFEPFTSLSLPVSFDPNRNKARLSVVYIYDTDKFTRYDLYFSPGKYSLQEVSDRLKNEVQNDRKDLRYGKRVFILADL
jgi:GGDEF domain-containing protein